MQNLLEIGKIVRTHGIKGAVKVMSYLDDVNFSMFKHIYIGNKKAPANIERVSSLNNDAYMVYIDIIKDIDTAEKYRNQIIYIDRDEYDDFSDKLYLSDLLGKSVLNEKNEKIGELLDYDDYGATVILSIKCGTVTYSLPYVDEIIEYDRQLQAFVVDEQRFKDTRI